MSDSNETSSSSRNTGRWVLIVIGIILATTLVVCCGAPLTLYYTLQARQEAPVTPEPLEPRELLDWFRHNAPDQPFVFHDETRDNVDLRGKILEINRGSALRTPSTSEDYRKRIDEMKPMFAERYKNAGEAQLVFHGDQDNQEVICWFKTADMVKGLAVGQEVVVRGRKWTISGPVVEYDKKGIPKEKDGGFTMELQRCRVVSP
ncbi:hypothetical protein [Bremerella sp. P1]|uniref:hypothetical protein n=1 Tax=Bremerella sp. P1 TaxID=3026424 RepID=UPI0023675B96|nr:hypothetical protein [Bremerella sp. P1]WDI43010.1 hypothetical protein PSR63_03500 [Bremerella sp. P1]